jgi:hypothetical protein
MTSKATVVVQLSRAIQCDGRMVDSVVIGGAPGAATFPLTERDGQAALDVLEFRALVARRVGLPRPALDRLAAEAPFDLQAILFAMFLPTRNAEPERARAKKR